MNELLAPIFYVIFADPLLEDVEQVNGHIVFIYMKLDDIHEASKSCFICNILTTLPFKIDSLSFSIVRNILQAEADAFFCFSSLLQMNAQFELFCRSVICKR